MVMMKNSISGIPVTFAMMTDFKTLPPRDTLARMVGLILAGSQPDFPVVDANGSVMGIVERDAFMSALSEQGQSAPVTEVMRRDVPEVDSDELVENVLTRLEETGVKVLPVTHAGQFIGLITKENITEFLMIRSALKTSRGMA